jgi:hypothetical protein
MTVIPCQQNTELRKQIEKFAETLTTDAHKLGDHGLDEKEFYNSGLFRGAIERLRGQFSSTMRNKREFAKHVLNHLEDQKLIKGWEEDESVNRHDYSVTLNTGKVSVIALTGCMDGNNTTLFERPAYAQEFVIWSLCTNAGADPRRNAWSGIHTRLSAEIISRKQPVDGMIIWDMMCGTLGRPCPKLTFQPERQTIVGPFKLPPACVYVLPSKVEGVIHAPAQNLSEVELLEAFHKAFKGQDGEVNFVDFDIETIDGEIRRKTIVRRAQMVQRESEFSPIRRA